MTELDYQGTAEAASTPYSRNQTDLKPFPSAGSASSSIKTTEPVKDHRRRRSSSIISHVEPETFEDENDQQLLPNMNATWVDQRGAWIIHVVIIILLKLFYNLFPGVTTEWSWTLTNMTYVIGSYVMFHLIKGTPFDFNGGAYDNLTMWEQIDDETLYTPSRKFLISVPIALFLVSTHYAHYDLKLFSWNCFLTTFGAVVPKLPVTHRLRISIPGITGRAQIS
ncbi:CNT_collapsed_G0019720.mRNA.1.CDS.1 [Saccharomyces cerevisiae]|nr:Orm1p [Saccharomyces cerevisiae YJM1463]CAI4465913.1 CNB_1a_G0020350.mRNA.1.CDS.1 [Saccharomyces cerevisiae]CAI5271742.1 CNT_HP2_G0021560.mRNA.1.CDS.1 [Saccharomyces cerevisiae]CAI6476094.1 CNT_HP1_G0019020.mRNA.1.CDS.1 [Saccharomyces cerevisiae]CAI6514124.1 CNT_HP2_G0021560.mRNA.1.CDS.1 [Saccharomyces cerevisiae]